MRSNHVLKKFVLLGYLIKPTLFDELTVYNISEDVQTPHVTCNSAGISRLKYNDWFFFK